MMKLSIPKTLKTVLIISISAVLLASLWNPMSPNEVQNPLDRDPSELAPVAAREKEIYEYETSQQYYTQWSETNPAWNQLSKSIKIYEIKSDTDTMIYRVKYTYEITSQSSNAGVTGNITFGIMGLSENHFYFSYISFDNETVDRLNQVGTAITGEFDIELPDKPEYLHFYEWCENGGSSQNVIPSFNFPGMLIMDEYGMSPPFYMSNPNLYQGNVHIVYNGWEIESSVVLTRENTTRDQWNFTYSISVAGFTEWENGGADRITDLHLLFETTNSWFRNNGSVIPFTEVPVVGDLIEGSGSTRYNSEWTGAQEVRILLGILIVEKSQPCEFVFKSSDFESQWDIVATIPSFPTVWLVVITCTGVGILIPNIKRKIHSQKGH